MWFPRTMSLFWGVGVGVVCSRGRWGVGGGVSWCLQPAGWQKDTGAYSQKEMEWSQKMLIIGEPRKGLYGFLCCFSFFMGSTFFKIKEVKNM